MLVKHGTPLNCVYCYLAFVEKKKDKRKKCAKGKEKKNILEEMILRY